MYGLYICILNICIYIEKYLIISNLILRSQGFSDIFVCSLIDLSSRLDETACVEAACWK